MTDGVGVIYVITCLKGTRKQYVGQHCSTRPEKRWNEHRACAVNGGDYPLYRAMRKYGLDSFQYSVVWRGSRHLLNKKETYYIKKLGTHVDDKRGGGYNLRAVGEVSLIARSSRKKMSASMSALYAADPTLRKRIGEGVKAAMQADPTILQRISPIGRKFSEETKKKLSKKKKAFYAANPHRKKECGAVLRGKPLSAVHKAKLSEAAKRRAPRKRTAKGTYA